MSLPLIDEALARDNPDELLQLAISLALDPPEDAHPGAAENALLILARHPNFNVRGNAILGFGHLGRTAGVIRATEDVRALVQAALTDDNAYIRGQADSAASDLVFFLGWEFDVPPLDDAT